MAQRRAIISRNQKKRKQVERVRARRRRENYSENAGKQNETELE